MEDWNLKQLLLYKLDRTLAVIGVVILGLMAMQNPESDSQVALVGIGGLVTFIGAKAAMSGSGKGGSDEAK
jgi:type IV secretory pathway VirB2 component (pilin)